MKTKNTALFIVAIGACVLAAGYIWAAPDAAPELRVRPPLFDAEGHFWVYRNGPMHPHMPFLPYGWMSDSTATNLNQLIKVDLECRDHPNTIIKGATASETDYCIRIKFTWQDATWCSVAFISGPDKPPWWGENNIGRYYNLSSLPKKKLIFFARGEHGGESIQAQIGVLGQKPFGDSLPKPLLSEELKLTQDWARYEIDLNQIKASDLAHICNGFGVIAQLASQPGTPTETVVYIDDVYYE
jgi:hypothetical protein